MTENFGFPERKPGLKIETIKTADGSEVSFCPERGGIITSIKLGGKEILYFDEETFLDPEVNVKGGIPVLFPNSGPINSEKFPDLKQHGFARLSPRWWALPTGDEGEFREDLLSSEDSRRVYPYYFRLSLRGLLEKNGSFTLLQQVENLENDREMPISIGLHPYFRVPRDRKGEIRFNFEGGKVIEKDLENWSKGGTTSVDNPKVKDSTAVMEVVIPSLGTLVIDASPEYRMIKIWSLPDKDFVCIEPVMRDDGGLVDDPEMIKPEDTFSARVNLSLKQNET